MRSISRQHGIVPVGDQRQFEPVGEEQREQQEERRAQRILVALLLRIAEFDIGITHHLLRPAQRAPERDRIEYEPGDELVEQFFQRLQETHKIHFWHPRGAVVPAYRVFTPARSLGIGGPGGAAIHVMPGGCAQPRRW
ncbi:hypothetical protein J2Y63_003969 [Shinella sp. BE166]|uniref:hypothetical protein n=1 Tax=Shinella sp. BE166 TaxID=3373918 RepID=UPI003EC051E7